MSSLYGSDRIRIVFIWAPGDNRASRKKRRVIRSSVRSLVLSTEEIREQENQHYLCPDPGSPCPPELVSTGAGRSLRRLAIFDSSCRTGRSAAVHARNRVG